MSDTFDPARVAYVSRPEQVENLLAALAEATEVTYDLETTGLNEHAPRAAIVAASFTLTVPGNSYPPTFVMLLDHPASPMQGAAPDQLRRVMAEVEQRGLGLIGHNLKFDLRWTHAHTGLDLSHLLLWDTQIAAHLLDENASTKLKEVAPRTFGVQRWDDFDLSTPHAAQRVPIFDLALYAARDTYWTKLLADHQRHRLFVDTPDLPGDAHEAEDARLGRLATHLVMPMAANLSRTEMHGIRLDAGWAESVRADLSDTAAKLFDDLTSRYPMPEEDETGRPLPTEPSLAPTSLWFREWARQAVGAGDLEVAALTPSGAPQWSSAVLTRQARTGSPVAADLLEWRGVTKKAEFLTSWLEKVTPSGTIHPTFHAGRVNTGRLSSSDPNLQQVTKSLRPAFIPRPGYLIAEVDYSQIELRIAAHVSGCVPMIEAFLAGQDLHSLMASEITGDPSPSPEDRQGAKAANFGYLYGMSAEGFKEYAETVYGVLLDWRQAEDARHAFFTLWEGLEEWHLRAVREADRRGYVVSPLGRIRRLPDLYHPDPRRASHAERNAINAPVQGMASDLMQTAAALVTGFLGENPVEDVKLLASVHDSIVVEVPAEDWKRSTARVMRKMIYDAPAYLERVLGCHLTVPLAAEAAVGTRWGLADVGVITG